MALDWCQNFVSAQLLENKYKLMEFDQILHMHWDWQDLGWDFRKFIIELWALIDVKNFDSAQYLENKLMKFDQIFYMNWYCQDLCLDYYVRQFLQIYNSYGPWLMSKFRFRSISWDQIDGIFPNFAYALILPSSRLGVLYFNFYFFSSSEPKARRWAYCIAKHPSSVGRSSVGVVVVVVVVRRQHFQMTTPL